MYVLCYMQIIEMGDIWKISMSESHYVLHLYIACFKYFIIPYGYCRKTIRIFLFAFRWLTQANIVWKKGSLRTNFPRIGKTVKEVQGYISQDLKKFAIKKKGGGGVLNWMRKGLKDRNRGKGDAQLL